jgi:hypothetical protein
LFYGLLGELVNNCYLFARRAKYGKIKTSCTAKDKIGDKQKRDPTEVARSDPAKGVQRGSEVHKLERNADPASRALGDNDRVRLGDALQACREFGVSPTIACS